MKKVMLLLLLGALCSVHFAEGLRCLTCTNARSMADCIDEGEMVTCREDQEMSCETEIRYEPRQLPRISKRCKQRLACENEQMQDPDQCNRNDGVCRCCCQENGCNRDNLWCSADLQCDLLERPRNGNKDCVFVEYEGEIGSSCTFSCDTGFALTGVEVSVCTEGTEGPAFTTASPICTRAEVSQDQQDDQGDVLDGRCEPLQIPEHGTMVCNYTDAEGEIGSVCGFACDFGYDLRGEEESVCRVDGGRASFSNPVPRCQRQEGFVDPDYPDADDIVDDEPSDERCPLLLQPENGVKTCEFDVEEGEIGAVCTFTCDDGFELRGRDESVCRQDGQSATFTDPAPVCQRIFVPTARRTPAEAISDPCDPSPCRNLGICYRAEDGYSCSCAVGFSGRNCGIDACNPSRCLNGGTCTRASNTRGYTCACTRDFLGTNCEIMGDPCEFNPCQNGGVCSRLGGNRYSCRCRVGFSGSNCQIDSCNPNRCLNGGTCIHARNSRGYACRCSPGFRGTNCRQEIPDACDPNPCQNLGVCYPTLDGYSCSCGVGFSGRNCGMDACNPNRCLNGGSCTRASNARGYTCSCRSGFLGTNCGMTAKRCESNPCQNGGACSSLDGNGYNCMCRAGYSGPNCEIDSCNPNRCLNGGTCIRARNPRGYVCRCSGGFRGYICSEEISDPCDPSPCRNGGVCSVAQGRYSCSCGMGFFGRNCGIDACNPNRCLNGGSCLRAGNFRGYTCSCRSGFLGINCGMRPNPCELNPCQNGGTCFRRGRGRHSCACRAGFSGSNCEIDSCNPNRCLNGGVCVHARNSRGYVCRCSGGFSGVNCGDEISDLCDPNPCRNGGICSRAQGRYSCSCGVGFSGRNCGIDACNPNRCLNGGSCNRANNARGYTCSCRSGFLGINCGMMPNPCELNPCQNGGTCSRRGRGRHSCACRAGFSGSNCEIDSCNPNRCLNGGACVHARNSRGYVCRCSGGFRGTNCGEAIRCDLLDRPENGAKNCVFSDVEGELGSTCTFSCDEGYRPDGLTISVCRQRGQEAQFTVPTPSCILVAAEVPTPASTASAEPPGRLVSACDDRPEAPPSGARSCFQSRDTVVCIYFCGENEYMSGRGVLTCTPSTGFDGTAPQCLRSDRCNLPIRPENGDVQCDGSGEVGTTCNFQCNSDCNLVGQTTSQCVMRNGEASWSCDVPVCERNGNLQK